MHGYIFHDVVVMGMNLFLSNFQKILGCLILVFCVCRTIQCIAGLKTCQMFITQLELTVLSQVLKCSSLITSRLTAFEKELTKIIFFCKEQH